MADNTRDPGIDLTLGVPSADLKEGEMIAGQVGEERVLVARVEGRVYAIGAECTHYHAPLEDGVIEGCAVRCPWHHAKFSLKTGEAIAAPAFDPVKSYRVTEEEGRIIVARGSAEPGSSEPQAVPPTAASAKPTTVVIIGGGAGGFAAAELLRRRGFPGQVVLVSDEADAPYDRPNCSKDFLAGEAPEEWMPLRAADYYLNEQIDLRLGAKAASIDVEQKAIALQNGERIGYDILILAMGAEPQRPQFEGAQSAPVFVLRSLADARAISHAAKTTETAVVIGASFIGLEAAAALRKRGLDVHVVAPETIPLAARFGEEVGRWIQDVHEKEGVVFHLGAHADRYDNGVLHLKDGQMLKADLVVVGVGVKPRVGLAEAAGLQVEDGVVVDDRLRAAPAVFAIGDLCRYPDPVSGRMVRIEHWVHAQRQGQHVARLILGEDGPYRDAPFFWSAHYGSAFHYQGHAHALEELEVEGSIPGYDAAVVYKSEGRRVAVLTVNRDRQSLEAEIAFEKRTT